jgi:glycerate dehydrogenase
MKIVVLDGHTLNPGDLGWDGLEALGECTVYERTPPAEVVARSRGVEIVLTNKTVIDRQVMEALPELRYVGVLATGYDVVDVRSAADRGITVTNVPSYGTESVAQAVFALLLELVSHVGLHAASVREGNWARAEDFCYWEKPITELGGLTMGIVGYGAIGRAVARIARAFLMEVTVHTEPPQEEPGTAFVGLDRLFAESDVVTLHCPLTPATRGLVGAERLALMKPTAFLLNTARGPLVDEDALARALNEGRIAGAGLDVLPAEPPPSDCPLLAANNCLITPHVAWAARASRERLMRSAVGNVTAFLAGRATNVVS